MSEKEKENKTIVDEALSDIKVIEEALKKNTKEILRTTMREEIDEIVKEYVAEDKGYEEEEIETDDEIDTDIDVNDDAEADTETDAETDIDDETDDETDVEAGEESETGEDEFPLPVDSTDDTIGSEESELDYDEMDMTAADNDDVIKVFKKLSDEDEIEVVSDKEVKIKDPESGNEYSVTMGDESPEEEEDTDIDIDLPTEESEEPIYEIALDEDIIRTATGDIKDSNDTAPNTGNIDDQNAPIDKETSGDNLEGGFEEIDPNKSKDGHGEHVMEREDYDEEEGEVPGEQDTGTDEYVDENKSRAQPDLHAQRVRPDGKKEYHTAPIGRANESVSKPKFNELLNVAKKLQTENKEVKQALKKFRKMLAESVVYNNNLTYMVKIITEHSTSKEEKQNIMKRFDDVKTLTESKKLYKTILGELNKKTISESVNSNFNKTQSSGSNNNITESTVYVDDSTKRIKDLISRVER